MSKGYPVTALAAATYAGYKTAYNYFYPQSSSYSDYEPMRNRRLVYANKTRVPAMGRVTRSRFKGKSRGKSYTKFTKKRKRTTRKKMLFKKRKSSLKRFARRLNKVQDTANPFKISQGENSQTWVESSNSINGNSQIQSVDVGLNRYLDIGEFGIFDQNLDDISYILRTELAIADLDGAQDYNNDIIIEKCFAKVCLRNNTNIGCHVDVYHCSQKRTFGSTLEAPENVIHRFKIAKAMQESMAAPDVNIDHKLTNSSALSDFSAIASRFKLKKIKSYIHYPAVTKYFQVSSPVGNGTSKKISSCFNKTDDPRWHKSLLFIIKGLPVHRDDAPLFGDSQVCYGPTCLDVIISRKVKWRTVTKPTDRDIYLERDAKIPSIALGDMEIQPAVNPTNANVAS